MSRLSQAIYDIHQIDAMALQDKWINNLHPLAKLLVTFVYIVVVVSFHPYDLSGVAAMSIYLVATMLLGEISARRSLKQLKGVLLMVCVIGIANPFLDKTQLGNVGTVVITGGMVSMLSLMLKAIFTVMASYLLIVTTSIEKICYALRCLYVPKGFVTLVLLIYRYSIVISKETQRITQAYSLRAPKQKGVHIKAWGSVVGQLLLRSIERAQLVYESMLLRGYNGEFNQSFRIKSKVSSVIYFIVWVIVIMLLRSIPIFNIAGNLLLH